MNGEDQHLKSPLIKTWYGEYVVDYAPENTWDNRVDILVVRFRVLLNQEQRL